MIALCSEGLMFRKYLFRRSYVQMVSYSEDRMFRKSYVQKYLFRRSYAQKVLYVTKEPIFRIICLEGSTITSIVHWMHYNTIPWQALYIGCLTIPYHDKHCTLLSFTKWDYHEKHCTLLGFNTPYHEKHWTLDALKHLTMRSIEHWVPYNTLS